MLPLTFADMVDVWAKLDIFGSIQVTSEKSSGKPAFAAVAKNRMKEANSALVEFVFIKQRKLCLTQG